VAQTQVLAGFPDPCRQYGTKDLDLPFQHLLKSFKDDNLPPKPQLALPIDTIAAAASASQQPHVSPLAAATGDLITAAFYFLPCVGECTMLSNNQRTPTAQFWYQDVWL
jgi:hypothetical protein